MVNTARTKDIPSRKLPLLSTKLCPPSSRGALIQRPQLLETLRETLAGKLALIHAPAGFGKTTIAAQWHTELREAGVPVAWLSLDDSDNDLNRFLAYLAEAVRGAEPDVGDGLHDVIEANPGSAVDHVIDTLANGLSLLDGHFVLFLDDWHLISDAAVHDALRRLLARSPRTLHVVVTSRSRLGIPVTRLRVQNELVEIDAARLRFNLDESRTYLTTVKALTIPADDLLTLWRSTEGWAAALQLASLSLREVDAHERIASLTTGAATDIGEYLAENVVANLPADQVRFLLRSSVLDRLCSDLCVAVTGDQGSAARLEDIERQELFLVPLDEERRWFRFHHLFQSYLYRRLRSRSADEVKDLHLKAADWFAAQGLTTDAVKHALQADDSARAVELIEQDAMSLVERSHMSTLLNLVGQVPRTALFDRPRVQMAIAWACCLTHRAQAAEEALWHVERLAVAAAEASRLSLLDETQVVRACIGVYADRIEGIEQGVRSCLAHVDRCPPFAVAVAANGRAYGYLRSGEFGKVGPLMVWARPWHERCSGVFSNVYGRCFEGLAAHAAGRLAVAKEIFAAALDLATTHSARQSHATRLAGALLGQVLYEENELETAEQLLRESRLLGFEGGVVDFYLATYLASSRLKVFEGAPDEALEILEEGEETARTLSLQRLQIAITCERIRILLDAGDARSAEQMLAELDARSEPSGQAEDVRAMIAGARARLLLARGSAEAAVTLLGAQIEASRAAGRSLDELTLRILHSLALEAAGQPRAAERQLLDTINQGMPLGVVRSFLDEGTPLVTLLERARDKARKRVAGESAEFTASAQRLLALSRHADRGVRRTAGVVNASGGFTTRESEVLTLLVQGRSNKEIARAMAIGIETVKSYLKNIFFKLGVSTRAQAVAAFQRRAQ